MKINKSIKGNKITSMSITFETDEEIGCLEDMVVLAERETLRYPDHRDQLPDMLIEIKNSL